MSIRAWVADRGGIVRREDLLRVGFRRAELLRAALMPIGRQWLALDTAPPLLVEAARRRSRVACVSAAQHYGLSLLRLPSMPHLWAPPSARIPTGSPARMHRSRAVLVPRADQLVESLPDLLEHVVECLPHVEAMIVWESAIRRKLITRHALQRIAWRGPAARDVAAEASSASDSVLETIVTDELRHAGIRFRQQVPLLGHLVDVLIGDHLVIQLDGHELHASRRQRGIDAEQDARLQLEGYTVLRFTYEDVVTRLPYVLDMIRRSMAQGKHHADY